MDYSTFGYLVIAAYVMTALVFWQQIIRKSPLKVSASLIAAPVLLMHLILLAAGLFAGSALDLSLTKLVSLVSLSIATVLTLGHKRFSSILLLPPIFLFNAVALLPDLLTTSQYMTPFANNTGLAIHVGLALIAYAVFIMAALMAIQVWLIDYRLKHHGPLHGLPPLMVVDKQLNLMLHIGFVLLTASIVTGWLFLDNFLAPGQRHKAILTLIAWAIYAWMLWQDSRSGLSSKQMAVLSLLSGAVLTLAYFGSRFIREVLLS